jgi:cytochrome b561
MTEPQSSHGTVTRLFHWVVVLLVLIQIPAGIAMIVPATVLEQRTIDVLYIIHKGLGAVLLVVILLRVLWRLTHRPLPMPGHWPPLERRIASVTHGFIYVLLVVVPVSGYVRVIADGFPIELLDWLGVPPLLPNMPAVASVASLVHRFAVFVLVGLVAVHIAEVLRHQLVERDGEMARMWPPVGGGSGGEV